MKVWTKTQKYKEGKYLVVRRDGTIPTWPHFVLGACDAAAPAALNAYAQEAHDVGMDIEYCDSIKELAFDFDRYRDHHGDGDPDAAPHRTDDPAIISLMRDGGKVRHDLTIAIYKVVPGMAVDLKKYFDDDLCKAEHAVFVVASAIIERLNLAQHENV